MIRLGYSFIVAGVGALVYCMLTPPPAVHPFAGVLAMSYVVFIAAMISPCKRES